MEQVHPTSVGAAGRDRIRLSSGVRAVEGRVRRGVRVPSVEGMAPPTTRRRPAAPAGPLAELGLFVREGLRDPGAVGAVAPSGSVLVRALARPAVTADRPVWVLEVGAGTGRVTRALAGGLVPGSHLDVVEANPRFAEHLARTVRAAESAVAVRVVCALVEDLAPTAPYDHVVSALPFTNFGADVVEDILRRYSAWLRPGGRLAYFAYRGTGLLRRVGAPAAELRRHLEVEEVLTDHRRGRTSSAITVWRNVPPAVVRYVDEPAAGPAVSGRTGGAS